MGKIPTIEINLDEKCKGCGKGGTTQSGYCLDCIMKRKEKAMNLQVSIKKVSTTKKDEGIDAQVVLEFLVTPRTMQALYQLMELQDQSVDIQLKPAQQEMFSGVEA